MIAIIAGNNNDLTAMQPASDALKELNLEHEVEVVKSHDPEWACQYAKKRGIKIIIAGTGSIPKLPEVISSSTILPVIGVLFKSDEIHDWSGELTGKPSVAAISSAKNAGLLAAKIMSFSERDLK